MHILITGGTGLIGQQLCRVLGEQGHQLTVLSRSPKKVATKCGAVVNAMSSLDEWTPEKQFDVVINLAGEPIADKLWTSNQKQILWDTRVTLTNQLVSKIEAAKVKPMVLLSGSAIGYYGERLNEELDETAVHGHGFSAELCMAWEQSALAAEKMGVRVCLLRTGLVLSKKGGILSKMKLPFGVGVRFGEGSQWMSWIHMQDYIQIVLKLMGDKELNGAFNMTAPNPVRNSEFTTTLVNLQKGIVSLSTPAFILKIMLGERSALLLESQRVLPKKIVSSGYVFCYTALSAALGDLLF